MQGGSRCAGPARSPVSQPLRQTAGRVRCVVGLASCFVVSTSRFFVGGRAVTTHSHRNGNKNMAFRDLTLKVLDLSSEIAFYEAFGFHLDEKSEHRALLSAGEGAWITLKKLANGRPRPPKMSGLFHFALLLPDRASLGAFVRFAARDLFHFVGTPAQGLA
jgi:hypothetical protein